MSAIKTTRCPSCGGLTEQHPTTRAHVAIDPLPTLAADLEGAPEDCWRFFRALFSNPATPYRCTNHLARDLAVVTSTFITRFYRAGLPSPKRYLEAVQLFRAAQLLEDERRSVIWVANELDFSSPQSFHRLVRRTMGMTAVQFAAQYDGARAFERFRTTLVLPHRAALLGLQPLAPTINPRAITRRSVRHGIALVA